MYELFRAITLIVYVLSAFLALKHAPKYMVKVDQASGKLNGGGSIVLTASGEQLEPTNYLHHR